MRTIKQAAVKIGDEIYTLPRPARHGDIYGLVHAKHPKDFNSKVDGFLTDADEFVDRRQAAAIAYNARQIISDDFTFISLYTEDLW